MIRPPWFNKSIIPPYVKAEGDPAPEAPKPETPKPEKPSSPPAGQPVFTPDSERAAPPAEVPAGGPEKTTPPEPRVVLPKQSPSPKPPPTPEPTLESEAPEPVAAPPESPTGERKKLSVEEANSKLSVLQSDPDIRVSPVFSNNEFRNFMESDCDTFAVMLSDYLTERGVPNTKVVLRKPGRTGRGIVHAAVKVGDGYWDAGGYYASELDLRDGWSADPDELRITEFTDEDMEDALETLGMFNHRKVFARFVDKLDGSEERNPSRDRSRGDTPEKSLSFRTKAEGDPAPDSPQAADELEHYDEARRQRGGKGLPGPRLRVPPSRGSKTLEKLLLRGLLR